MRKLVEANSITEYPVILSDNASRHKNYKMYTSMEQALEFLAAGYLYLSNGENWNDFLDKQQMENKHVYGRCFSTSTRENVAMWYMYSGDNGKSGAAINFATSAINSILDVETIEVVKCNNKGNLTVLKELYRKQFDIFLTDVLYVDNKFKDTNKRIITYGDEHIQVTRSDIELLKDKDVFIKSYEWEYEKECRLIVRPSVSAMKELQKLLTENAENNALSREKTYVTLRLKVPEYKSIKPNRIIKSPLYAGRCFIGENSALYGEVIL